VVVLDLQLKQGNGFNVLKAIRHSESVEHKKVVVVLTNYAFSLYRHRCLQAGADFFLDKAREYERLPQVLEAMAEGRAALQDQ
jgi:DNA-binding NarL/FixJ family response regulator